MNRDEVLSWLERRESRKVAEGLARYGIQTNLKVFGVPMGKLLELKKQIGRDHELAQALWASGYYEGRLLAALVDDPQKVTRRQMNMWAGDFENWGDCDTVCFHLFDRTPFAWEKVHQWSASPREFVKRAAFALIWGLTVHDKASSDEPFLDALNLIEQAASDERHFVKKAVNMALRAIGKRNAALHQAALAVANRLATSTNTSARWVGKDAVRELDSANVRARAARKKQEKEKNES